MPRGSAERQKRLRERRDLGRIVLPIEFVEVEVVEALQAAGLLHVDPNHNPSRKAIREALERALVQIVNPVTRNDMPF